MQKPNDFNDIATDVSVFATERFEVAENAHVFARAIMDPWPSTPVDDTQITAMPDLDLDDSDDVWGEDTVVDARLPAALRDDDIPDDGEPTTVAIR